MDDPQQQPESLISPGINHTALLWIILLGLPALLLFLILEKQQGL